VSTIKWEIINGTVVSTLQKGEEGVMATK